jgi:hypothetical protein
MRKNINKLVAVAIGISVMSGSVMPVFAADTATTTQNTSNIIYVQNQVKPVLTLEAAINAAIDNSEILALKSKKIKLEEDKLDLQEEIDDDGYLYDSQEVAVKQEKEDKEFLEDQIKQTVTDKYTDLVAKTDELNKLKKQIEIKSKQLNDSELKKKLGMITSIDMESAQNDLQTQKNNQKLKEDQLKNSQDYFKVLTVKDLNQYSLEQDQKYEIFRISGSADEYFDNIIDKYFRYDKDGNELLKDYVKDIKTDKPDKAPEESDYEDTVDADGNTTRSASDKYKAALADYNQDVTAYKTYLEMRYNSSAAAVGLDEKKKSYKQILKDSYASLLDLENKINVMKSSIEVNNKQLSIAKLKYDMGLIIKADYDNQVLANMDYDTNLRTLINNYNKLKNSIQKPWILSSSSGM